MRASCTALLLAAWLGFLGPVQAAPGAPRAPVTLSQGLVPVDPAVVERSVAALLSTWNTPGFAAMLAPDFPGRERLLSALAGAPLTARLELAGLGGIQTLEQVREAGALISLVSATARVVLLYDDAGGPQRREGTVELILRVRREAPRR